MLKNWDMIPFFFVFFLNNKSLITKILPSLNRELIAFTFNEPVLLSKFIY